MLWRLGRHGPLQKSRHSKKHGRNGDLVSNVYTFPLHKMHWCHSQTGRLAKASLGLRVFVADAPRHFQQRKTAGNGGSGSRLAVKALQTRKTADNVGDGQEEDGLRQRPQYSAPCHRIGTAEGGGSRLVIEGGHKICKYTRQNLVLATLRELTIRCLGT